ncbi:hypothetical protein BpHYR1_050843 [Brachionus plicatilis]|uniref:Uncharacterized protein n=1 Tax=Brachionus plicatilis TaxID=10195 RepID=A0A3M7P9W0_BRAPC|nr:hypothetical protein BpHYR1_050843 [Brachionus plicatilis]
MFFLGAKIEKRFFFKGYGPKNGQDIVMVSKIQFLVKNNNKNCKQFCNPVPGTTWNVGYTL